VITAIRLDDIEIKRPTDEVVMPSRVYLRINPDDPWPKTHGRDTDFTKRCVRCGEVLISYEKIPQDWPRPYSRGVARHINPSKDLFGGLHCELCFNAMKNILHQAIKQLDDHLTRYPPLCRPSPSENPVSKP
jgi:hypothetical protein